MLVSYCTSCKGRLWQLLQTLPSNVKKLKEIDAEWIIFDNHCPDNTAEEILKFPLVRILFEQEKIKIFKLMNDYPFSMPLSKNLSHSQGIGNYLFNLDADNFITESFKDLGSLRRNEFLWSASYADNGTMGRLGVKREDFYELQGYDLALYGAGYDDIDFKDRLLMKGLNFQKETFCRTPIQNTRQDTMTLIPSEVTHSELYRLNAKRSLMNRENGTIRVNPNGMLRSGDVDISVDVMRIS